MYIYICHAKYKTVPSLFIALVKPEVDVRGTLKTSVYVKKKRDVIEISENLSDKPPA